MKAKVLQAFKDKHSGRLHKAGDVITISKERYEEILTVGKLVEEIKKAKAEREA